jgi:hypothetical protein
VAAFDIITSDELRASLDKDAEELIACMKAGAWKGAHVLAGSLIHAILVDYLVSSGKGTEQALVQLSFSDMLDLCKAQGMLSPRTVELASFIRPYADFLSPSSQTRLRTTTDETSARIAQALMEIVINEISAHRRENYRHTAEQIVAKLRSDPSSDTILSHLVGKVSRVELERLLIELLPKAYFELAKSAEPSDEETLKRIEMCYRLGFEVASPDSKRTVIRRFLYILEHECEFVVQCYEGCFFRGSDLEYLAGEERSMVKEHFFASISKQPSLALVNAAAGVGAFLETEEDARSFFVPLVLHLLEGKDEALCSAIVKRVSEEFRLLSQENQKSVGGWVGRLCRSVQLNGTHQTAAKRLGAALAGF